ncbi:MAG: AAA family ATPase [Deltaproteobacteria bacterium]|nr:AAA family ATPase [Deltaproteobacteria bacterium]
MQIKRLELLGFKSFVDPTVVEFDRPLVGVVGPNGCGKSNIVDAIRWVMGEMSAKSLRGRAMEDVIFNGSESRPPVGMAEVTLTFSTEDGLVPPQYAGFTEISITRRLFRDGESEYLINKVPARLRDIVDLFLGTGVGHRAYSVIEQGKIDFAINAKPEDRRYLIEEVAGISKFKARKEAALRKMEGTEQNLLRLKDILVEVTRQINSLDRQVKKAEKYRQLKEEHKQLDLKLSAALHRESSKEVAELGTLLEEWTQKESEAQGNLQTIEMGREKERLSQIEKERELSELQERTFEASSRYKLLQTQQDFHERERKRLEEEKKESLENLKVGENLQGKVEEIQNQLSSLRSLSTNLKEELERVKTEIVSKKEKKENLDKELLVRREELSLKRSHLMSLIDLERNFEGYQEGVRTILKAKKQGEMQGQGVLGVVADVVESPPEYELAVSAALGEKLQYVIVKSHDEGVEAVSYLKTQASGRSSFITLDIRESEPKPFPYKDEGVIGPLLDLVRLRSDYSKIGTYLLGDVILVKSLEKALSLWRSNGHHKTLVTPEGEVVDPYGIVSGGSAGLPGKLLLEKKREIKELKGRVAVLEEEISLIEDSASQYEGSLSELGLLMEDLKKREFQEDLEKISLEKECDGLKKELDRLQREQEKIRLIEEKMTALSSEKEAAVLEMSALQKMLEELALKNEKAKGDYEAISLELGKKETALRDLRKSYDLARSHTGDLRVTLSRQESDLRHLESQIFERYGLALREVASEFQEGENFDRVLEEQRLEELKQRLDKIGDVNLGAIPEYEELKGREEFLKKQIQDLEEAIGGLKKAITKINETTRRRFEETFDLVNEKFQVLFPRLFHGGRAELRLTDGNEGVQRGVELLVQPPGKKLSHIGLLSGGEKALSAIAFIFSLFLIKPSPFCILDEVDAPLDDLNVSRFHILLSEMLPRSQFILITHNRRTMEQCHLLYGVTMEEAGISKIVSVKLAENLPLAS